MIPFATPMASQAVSSIILNETAEEYSQSILVSGIKACQKLILSSPKNRVVVFSAKTSPMDLITHLPILCEENNVPYIFVEDNKWIKDFTCVALIIKEDNTDHQAILSEATKTINK